MTDACVDRIDNSIKRPPITLLIAPLCRDASQTSNSLDISTLCFFLPSPSFFIPCTSSSQHWSYVSCTDERTRCCVGRSTYPLSQPDNPICSITPCAPALNRAFLPNLFWNRRVHWSPSSCTFILFKYSDNYPTGKFTSIKPILAFRV